MSKEFDEIKTDARNTEDIESFLIKEHLGQIKLDDLSVEKEELLVKSLIKLLSSEKQEGRLCLILKRVKKTQSRVLELEF